MPDTMTNRLTDADRVAIVTAMEEALAAGARPHPATQDRDSLARIGLRGIGCTRADMRGTELYFVDAAAVALIWQRDHSGK